VALTGTGDHIGTVVPDQFAAMSARSCAGTHPTSTGLKGSTNRFCRDLGMAVLIRRLSKSYFQFLWIWSRQKTRGSPFRAPSFVLDGQLQIVLNFKPVEPGGRNSRLRNSGAEPTANGKTHEWRWEIPLAAKG